MNRRQPRRRKTPRPDAGRLPSPTADTIVRRLEKVVETIQLGVTITDSTGRILYVNPADAAVHGYAVAELIGQDVGIYAASPKRRQLTRTELLNLASWQRESTNVRKDGTTFPVRLLSDVVLDRDGEPIGVITTCEDITDRKRAEQALREARDELERRVAERTAELARANADLTAEMAERQRASEALRESEARHRDLVERSLGLISTHALDGTLLSVNPAAARLLGRSPEELVGANLESVLAPSARPLLGEYLETIRREGVATGLMRVQARDGGIRTWTYHNVLRHREGEAPYVLAHALDVTDLNRTERALRRSEAKYRGLVENATYGICLSTPDGRLLSANPALVRMLGYESELEVLGLDLDRDIYAEPGERTRLMERYRSGDRVKDHEVRWKRKDGSRVTVRLGGRVLLGAPGEPECFEEIVVDVTEQRLLEAQLRQAQKMEAVGQLTAGIAHDFNNLLSIIVANAELITSILPPGEEGVRANIADIHLAARRGAEMVRKLLAFGRRGDVTLEPVDLGRLAIEASAMLRRILPENIVVRVTGEAGVGAAQADTGAVEQILLNLATNARDAMPSGGVLAIEVALVRLDRESADRAAPWVPSGAYVVVTVRDTGTGMDEGTQARAFEPFFTTKAPGQGSGLGLAMVYGLMKQHHGYVAVESERGRGTTVTLYFPMAHQRAAEPAGTPPAAEPLRGGSETVLVVEDEESVRRSARRVLEQFGYTVLVAADGQDALDLWRTGSRPVDLVLADVVMPRMGGLDLYTALRKEGSAVPFLFMTGYAPPDVQHQVRAAADSPLLQKPWTIPELVSAVRRLLDRPRAS